MASHTWWGIVGAGALGSMVCLGSLGACSNEVRVWQQTDEGGSGQGGYLFLDAGEGGRDSGPPPADALSDYVDPGCPDQPPPIYDFQCDPYDQHNGDCAFGEGCYIYVQYPSEPCGQEIYGSVCYPQGSGQQGDFCAGALDCAASHVCVVTGSGNQCVKLCPLSGYHNCPSGMVCHPIDVEGFGGCL